MLRTGFTWLQTQVKSRSVAFIFDVPPTYNHDKHCRFTDVQIKLVFFNILLKIFVNIICQMFFSPEECNILDMFFLYEYIMRVRYFSEFGNLRGVVDYLKRRGGDLQKLEFYHSPHPVLSS